MAEEAKVEFHNRIGDQVKAKGEKKPREEEREEGSLAGKQSSLRR